MNKKVLMISGVHGNELTPLYTTYLLRKKEKESEVNEIGLINNVREFKVPVNNNLNNAFSQTEISMTNCVKELKKKIDEHDIIIDIHSSYNCTECVLLNQDETTNSYVEYCKKNGINYVIRYSNTDTIKKYCIEKNKIAFTIESNGVNYINIGSSHNTIKLVDILLKNITNLKVIKSEPIYQIYKDIFTFRKGFLIFKRNVGEVVAKDNLICDIIENNKSYPIKSDCTGRIIAYADSDYVCPGKSVCIIQE